jgi:hypothetical protein
MFVALKGDRKKVKIILEDKKMQFIPNEKIVRDVIQVATVFKPWTGSRNVIGCALALNLDQNGHVDEILAVPFVEGLQQLQTVAVGVNIYTNLGAVLKR